MKLSAVTIYPTALCNLDCSYCTLTKNNALHIADKDIKDSYLDENYYLNQLMALGEDNIKDITKVDFWGGEPTLKLHRTHNTVRQFIEYLPSIKEFFFSTNFTYSKVEEEIEGLIDVLGEYSDRNFTLKIQLSIDGPPEITDSARGIGVTEKFLENYELLVNKRFFADKYPNVSVVISYKPTLDINSVKKFLDVEYMIYYYKWFEDNLFDLAETMKNNKFKAKIRCLPNIAVPSPVSQQDGIDFATVCRNSMSVNMSVFRYYQSITMFVRGTKPRCDKTMRFCGAGSRMVELLPNGLYCGCHRAFLTFCDEYRELVTSYGDNKVLENRSIMSDSPNLIYQDASSFIDFCNNTNSYKTTNSAFHVGVMTVMYLAYLGQIDPKYVNKKEAEVAVQKYAMFNSTCVYDNYTSGGSQMVFLLSSYRLWLNGAIDIAVKANERGRVVNEFNKIFR